MRASAAATQDYVSATAEFMTRLMTVASQMDEAADRTRAKAHMAQNMKATIDRFLI